MNPIDILAKYYKPGSKAFEILVAHGEQVARKARAAAEKVSHLKPDLEYIENAAMLHDIGIMETDTPQLGCRGKHPYICHGILGRKMLEKCGVPNFGPICERHVGVGISADDVRRHNLPLPAATCCRYPSKSKSSATPTNSFLKTATDTRQKKSH